MSGIIAKIIETIGSNIAVSYLERIFGRNQGESDATKQVTSITEALPDEMDSTEDLEASLEFLDGLSVEQDVDTGIPGTGRYLERKTIQTS
jgi:hypothetical protein